MSLIVLERGTLSFGPQPILSEASVRIGEGDKIGLIGANGTGKSTLFRVLNGAQVLDSGQVTRAKGCRVGYLPQDVTEVVDDTLLASVLGSVPGRADLEERVDRTRRELEEADDPDVQMSLARRLADLTDQVEHFERYYSEHQAMRILKGLGFSERDFARPTRELSGGWRMRAALAGMLFQQPDVLLLDEPTNHLDVPSVVWFNQFLEEYRNAVVLICHDREFLNRHVQRVISFEPEGLRGYRGNFDAYLKQRESEESVLAAETRKHERRAKELERFVVRYRARKNKARQAQSRAKQLDRLQRRLEEQVVVAPRKQLSFSFPEVERSGKDVLVISELHKAYGDQVLFAGLSRGVYAGDRVAIIGPNGVGKTTLLKMLAGELEADSGEIRYGTNVKVGYFAQHHTELLDTKRTVLEEVRMTCPKAGESFVRGVCGAFLFSGDDVDKPVGILSGGERARVLLARLLANPGNLLLMDEPTTHLDLNAAEALAEALAGFGGTLVLVSHNTAFVNHLATRVWDVRDGDVIEYPGNLAEYLEHQAHEASDGLLGTESDSDLDLDSDSDSVSRSETETEAEQGAAKETRQERQERKRKEAERRNELSRRTREAREEIEALEAEITVLEHEQAELEPRLADPALHADGPRFRDELRRWEQIKKRQEELVRRWERQQAELEAIQAEFDSG